MPLYFFWGEEDFNIELSINKLKKDVLGNDRNALNYRTLDNPPFAVLDEAMRTSPMMFGDILYVIKADKYFLESQKKFTLDDVQTDILIKSMENIALNVHIALLCPIERGANKKPDARKKLYKSMVKIADVREFPAFKPYEDYKISPWVRERAKIKDITLSNDVILELIHTCGASLRDLDTSMEKLKLLAYPNKTIAKEMVEQVSNVNQDIFKISDLIIEKKYETALNDISNLLEKSHYLQILAILQTSFSSLLKTKLYSTQFSGFELAKQVGLHEFVVKKNLEKLSSVPLGELVRLKQNLVNVEFMLKSGTISDPILAFQLAMTASEAELQGVL